jgi:hypothetical protein
MDIESVPNGIEMSKLPKPDIITSRKIGAATSDPFAGKFCCMRLCQLISSKLLLEEIEPHPWQN